MARSLPSIAAIALAVGLVSCESERLGVPSQPSDVVGVVTSTSNNQLLVDSLTRTPHNVSLPRLYLNFYRNAAVVVRTPNGSRRVMPLAEVTVGTRIEAWVGDISLDSWPPQYSAEYAIVELPPAK